MSLTDVSYYVRKFAPVVIIGLLSICIFYFSARLFFLYLNSGSEVVDSPTEVIEANPAFGVITRPIIADATSSSDVTFILDTLDGTTRFETATSAATVYFIPKQSPTFGFLSTIYNMASQFDIDTTQFPHTLEENLATFDDGVKKIGIDITTFNFAFTRKIEQSDGLFDTSLLPREQFIESEAQNLLREVRYPSKLATGKRNISYFFYNPELNRIEPKADNIGANMVEVDFFRPDIGQFPFVTSSYFNSSHYVLFAINKTQVIPVRAQVVYHQYSAENSGVYPLRTPDQAWQDLQDGKGYIISQRPDQNEVKIQRIFLGYYDPEEYQEYLQPVYVFLGENRFVAYVTAVSDEYLASETD